MLIVETIALGGIAAQSGLEVGDCLRAYNNQVLISPAQLEALSENTFGGALNSLEVHRQGQERMITVPSGKLGMEVHPVLPPEMETLYQQGYTSLQADDMHEATRLWQEALQQVAEPRVLAWLNFRLGNLSKQQNDLQEAVNAYDRAYKILEANDDAAMHYLCLSAMGRCYRDLGDLSQAESSFRSALQLADEEIYPLWHAHCLTGLGIISSDRGDISLAQDYHLRSLKIKELLVPGSLAVARSLHGLGVVAAERGDLALAQDYFLRAFEIFQCQSPGSLDAAKNLHCLGIIAWDRGDLNTAQDYHLRALEIRHREAPGSLDMAGSLCNLGNLAFDRGDLSSAQDYYLRGLEICKRIAPNSLRTAANYTNLGTVARDSEDLSSAQDYFVRAQEIYEGQAPGSLMGAVNLNNLGHVAMDRGDLTSARDSFLRVLEIYQRQAPGSLEVANSLNNLGIVARLRGELILAQDHLQHALEICESLAPGSLFMAFTLNNTGDVYQKQHRYAEALVLHQHALDIVESQRGQIVSTQARSLLFAKYLDKYLSLLHSHLALNQIQEAFATVERCRARSLVEMLTERQIDFAQDAPAELRQQQQAIDQQRQQIYTTLADLDVDAKEQFHELHSKLIDLDRQQQDLTARIRQESPHYAGLQYPQPLDLTGVQAMLDPGTLALVYQTDEEQTYLFAVTKERCDLHLLPIGREELEQKVTTFRKVLDVRLLENTLKQAVEQGQELHAILIAPAQAAQKKAKRLLLCPEGPLLMLPFACLVTNTAHTPRYLGEQMPLHQTTSLTVYAQTRQEKRKQRESQSVQSAHTRAQEAPSVRIQSREGMSVLSGKRVLALGDPRYPRTSETSAAVSARSQDAEVNALLSRGLNLSPLPHSRQEVEEIGRLFGDQATLHLDAEATKTIAKAECAHAAILHFACHAWLDHRFPLSSALVLSQPELLGEEAVVGDNGLLQAWEVMEQMKLEADLVVLSACETGLGQEVRGEGLVGLTRAFQYAGASSVLASLWEINDASTSGFMQAFYEALVEGASKDVAVQRGIQQLRKHPQWSHPYYWGAFALIGDWKA